MEHATIIFDFDGTLHDSMRIYRTALERGYQWLVEAGHASPRVLAYDEAAANIGLTAQEAWGILCPDLPWSITSKAASRVGGEMDRLIDEGAARLYPGVPAMLDELKGTGHTLVFLSNCRNAYLAAARRALGLDAWFDCYYTAEQFGGAPKEEIFETLEREVPGPYIAVGDRYKDLALARAHELPCIGCLYGYGAPGELDGATELARTPAEIPALVRTIEGYSDQ